MFGVFGIIGNVTSLFILSKLAAQSFFDSLLIALTSIDTVFIIFTVIDYSFARGIKLPFIFSFFSILVTLVLKCYQGDKVLSDKINIFGSIFSLSCLEHSPFNINFISGLSLKFVVSGLSEVCLRLNLNLI